MELSNDNDQKPKNLPIWKCRPTITKKVPYTCNKLHLQKPSLSLLHRNKSLLLAFIILFRSPITTASLDKLTCTDYRDFGKCQYRFGQSSRSKNDSNYLDVKLKVFKKDDNKEFRLVQNLQMGEAVYAIEETAGQCNKKIC